MLLSVQNWLFLVTLWLGIPWLANSEIINNKKSPGETKIICISGPFGNENANFYLLRSVGEISDIFLTRSL